jgi:hypothetical protein
MATPKVPTPEFTRTFAAATRQFWPFRVACWALGVKEQTVKRWLRRGESAAPGDERYAAFRRAYTEAHDAALAEVIARVVELAEGPNRSIGADAAAVLRKWARENPTRCPGLPDRFRVPGGKA